MAQSHYAASRRRFEFACKQQLFSTAGQAQASDLQKTPTSITSKQDTGFASTGHLRLAKFPTPGGSTKERGDEDLIFSVRYHFGRRLKVEPQPGQKAVRWVAAVQPSDSWPAVSAKGFALR